MRGGIMLVCVLSSLVLCARANTIAAGSQDFPYNDITNRNVFNLKAPPPPVDPKSLEPPPPKITLTGITTILGNKRALMKAPVPAKPPEPARDQSYILTEGQRDGDIEVLEINEKAATVKVNNHGTIQTLAFDTNSIAKQTSGGVPPPPGSIPMPGMPGPNRIGPHGRGIGNTEQPNIPARPLRLPGAPGANNAPNNSPDLAGGSVLPTQPVPNSQPENTLSAEEQAVIIEAQRLQYEKEGNPMANMLPTTQLTPRLKQEAGAPP